MNKKIKNLVRLVSIALLLLVVPIAFVGCGGDNESENPTGYIGTFTSKETFDYNKVFASFDNFALLFDGDSKVWLTQESEIVEYTRPPFDDFLSPRTENGKAYYTAEIGTELRIPIPDVCQADISLDNIAYTSFNGDIIVENDREPRIDGNELVVPIVNEQQMNGVVWVMGIKNGTSHYYTIYITIGSQDESENDSFVSVTGTADNCSWTDNQSFWLAYHQFTRSYSFVKTNDTVAELTINLSNDTTNIQVKYALSKVGEYWKLGAYTTSGLPLTIDMLKITLGENGQGTYGTAAPENTGGNYDTAFATQEIEYSVSGNTLTFMLSAVQIESGTITVSGTFTKNFTVLTLNLGGQSVAFDKAL